MFSFLKVFANGPLNIPVPVLNHVMPVEFAGVPVPEPLAAPPVMVLAAPVPGALPMNEVPFEVPAWAGAFS